MLSPTRNPMLAIAMALLLLSAYTVNAQRKSTAAHHFLFLSDIHLDTYATTTDYGADTGMDLWALFLRKADSVMAGPDAPRFIVYTGDLPSHLNPCCYLPPGQRSSHNNNIDTILTGLRRLADKYNKPLFYMPGNNDGLAGDYASFADEELQTPFSLVPDKADPYPALNILPGTAKAPCTP
jgi:sphingomyelin phosphodiesterase acid-like 3